MLHTPKPTKLVELKTALVQYRMICLRSSLIRQPCDFERDFDFVLLQLADTEHSAQLFRQHLRRFGNECQLPSPY